MGVCWRLNGNFESDFKVVNDEIVICFEDCEFFYYYVYVILRNMDLVVYKWVYIVEFCKFFLGIVFIELSYEVDVEGEVLILCCLIWVFWEVVGNEWEEDL